jgi:hypothetical protein
MNLQGSETLTLQLQLALPAQAPTEKGISVCAVELGPGNLDVFAVVERTTTYIQNPDPHAPLTPPKIVLLDRVLEQRAGLPFTTADTGNVGGYLTRAAVSRGGKRMDTFYNEGNRLGRSWRKQNGQWVNGPAVAGTSLRAGSQPTVASWGPDRLDVFYRSPSNNLVQITSTTGEGGAFGVEQNLGGSLKSDPAAISWSNNRIDVFYFENFGASSFLHHRWFEPALGWQGPERIGSASPSGEKSAPSVASWGPGRLDVVRRAGNSLRHLAYVGTGWTNWTTLSGGGAGGLPSIVSDSVGVVHVFYWSNTAKKVFHRWYN